MKLRNYEKNLEIIQGLEDKFDRAVTILQHKLNEVDFNFIQLKVDSIEFSTKHWTQMPLSYSKGVSCLGREFSNNKTKLLCKFDSGGYIVPHYHERKEVIRMLQGDLYIKLYENKKFKKAIALEVGDEFEIEAGQVHLPESENGCMFDIWWT